MIRTNASYTLPEIRNGDTHERIAYTDTHATVTRTNAYVCVRACVIERESGRASCRWDGDRKTDRPGGQVQIR